MANEILNLVLAPQFEVNITHDMGGNANSGFTIVAGIASTSSGSVMSDTDVKAAYERNADTNEFDDTEQSKLAGIEDGATTDQTNTEIRTAVGAAADSNIFTDMYQGVVIASASKLDGIETGATADQTDAQITTAYNNEVAQVSSQEITDGTETAIRRFSPDDIEAMAGLHGGGGFPANPVITGKLAWLTDVFLERDEANTLAMRNGYLVPQMFRIYNTFTDATNYERANIGWDSGIFFIGTSADGTGSNRGIAFVTSDTSRWAIGINGDFIAWTDNVLDIGATGANRAKDFFLAGTLALQNETANKSAMIISGYSLTGANAQNMVDLSGTWNTTGAPTLIYADVLDTASDAGAMLINLKVGGTSMFSVTKAGLVTAISGLGGMSDAEVKTAYENNANTNEFDDNEQTKLAGIETAADVTDAGNVASAGAIMDSDVSAGEGHLRKTGAGTYVAMKTNLGAAVAPSSSNDNTQGYVVGSQWIDTTADKEYVCLDISTGAAVWTETTGAGGGGMSDAEVKTAYENNANTNEFSDAEQTSLATMEDNATGDQSDSEIETAYNNQVAVVSAGEMTAGTEVAMRRFSPDNIENMIGIHGGSGGGGPLSGDPDWASVSLLVGANGADQSTSFLDEGPTAHALTANGNAKQVTATKKFGSASIDLDGAGDYVEAAPSSEFDFGDGDFTIEFWTMRASEPPSYMAWISKWDVTGNKRQWNFMYDFSLNTVTLYVSTTGSDFPIATFDLDTDGVSVAQFFDGNFHHVAAVRESGTLTIYVDGQAGAGTWAGGAASLYANTTIDMLIGARRSGGGVDQEMDAHIDEIRITKGVARYTAEFTPPTEEFLRAGEFLTNAEIKTAYELNADTNEFSDAEKTKLGTVDTNAADDQTGAEIKSAYESEANAYTDTKDTKLGTIEDSATADQTDAEIRTAVEAASDSNVFTDADHTKLNAIADASVSTKTDDYTLVLADAHNIIEMDKATAVVLKIPTNANEAYAIGTVVSIVTVGAGTCSITGDTGVTLNGVSAGSGDIAAQWDGVSIYKRATDEWVVNGAIGDVT